MRSGKHTWGTMMDTKTEELAALYVMDLLKGPELEDFERRVDGDEELKQLVHQLSTGLHAPLKQFNGPERMDLLEGIRERIGLAETAQPFKGSPVVLLRWARGLGIAAAILLVLNLYQFTNPSLSNLETELVASREAEMALLEENMAMKAFNKTWETEYMNLAERMMPFIGSNDGLGEFTVVDLIGIPEKIDNSGYAKSGDVADYIISRSPLQFASVHKSEPQLSNNTASMGYAVWKADESMGYLDLYNLSQAGSGRAPFLWMRERTGGKFVPVGYLPSLEDGTGTFYFEIDQEDFRPTEVLITEESLDGPGDQPSRHQMMVGP